MRSKSIGGGRPRLSKLPPHPSAMAFTYLCQLSDSKAHPESSHDDVCANEANNDGQCSTVLPETSSDSDLDRRCHELAPSTICETVVIAKESCGLDPQGMHGLEDCLEVDWTEKEVCIKCDKGGKLLVCSDSNCPLAVHEECMHCSARFDSMGNFYCPYCSYKRAMLETRKARKKAMLAKKALSVFLDKGMMDGDIQKQMAERVRRKKPNPSTVVGDIIEHDNTRSRLHDDDEIANHSVQMEVECRGERFDPECTTSSSKAVETSAMNEQNDVLTGCGDIARPDDRGQYKIVTDQQMHPGPVIACGGGDGGACCREEETGLQFKIVQVGKSVQVENPELVDDHQMERVVQDEQQARHLSASPMEKETNLNGSLHMSTEAELKNGEIVKEHESGRPEEEEMRDQEQGTTASTSGGDSMQQEHAKASDSSLGDSGDVSPHWRRIKKKNQNVLQSPNVESPRRSARKLSFEQNTNVVHKEKKNITNKSRQRITNLPFPNPRRKKLPWTAEEEDMLKEGVQKFSTIVNKNLPWRKILEFGRHVFDGTRTPADLKDKWRNILAKDSSTK